MEPPSLLFPPGLCWKSIVTVLCPSLKVFIETPRYMLASVILYIFIGFELFSFYASARYCK